MENLEKIPEEFSLIKKKRLLEVFQKGFNGK